MIKVIMNGCNGHMGRVITDLIATDPEIEITAGVDVVDSGIHPYPVFAAIEDCDAEADAIIDFSTASCVDALIAYSVKRQIPLVLCTTGLSDDQLAAVKEASGKVAILKSANMSLGINTLMELLAAAAKVLATAGFDMEIVEKHHKRKLDAPSGTAIALADAINKAMEEKYSYTYDRSQRRQPRDPYEIGIQALRGGTIVGEHEVVFAGPDEVITFKHTAYSRAIFGNGAIQAAKFLAGKPAGMYDMGDVIRAQQ